MPICAILHMRHMTLSRLVRIRTKRSHPVAHRCPMVTGALWYRCPMDALRYGWYGWCPTVHDTGACLLPRQARGIKIGHQNRASKSGIKNEFRQVRGSLVRHVNAVLLGVKRESATKKELRARANAEKEPRASKSPHCMGRMLKGYNHEEAHSFQ